MGSRNKAKHDLSCLMYERIRSLCVWLVHLWLFTGGEKIYLLLLLSTLFIPSKENWTGGVERVERIKVFSLIWTVDIQLLTHEQCFMNLHSHELNLVIGRSLQNNKFKTALISWHICFYTIYFMYLNILTWYGQTP